MRKPRIIVTAGDPAGIGPEIIAKAMTHKEVTDCADVTVVASRSIMEQAVRITGADLRIRPVTTPSEAEAGVLNLIDLANFDPTRFQFGEISARGGRAAYEFIEKAVELAMNGAADAIVTAPINKESLQEARISYIGHTEIIGAMTSTSDPLTMFETGRLRIFFLTRHISLRDMLEQISEERIVNYIRRCTAALHQIGLGRGTMAVAGLNPHCGEHGLFGTEEMAVITPAVRRCRKEGYNVVGPIAADSVFHLAAEGKYTSVLSMYHDQGHIAAKTLDFDRTISLTLGLPFLRTSVDHGTAFDIAGTGKAREISMVEAICKAAHYAPVFRKPVEE